MHLSILSPEEKIFSGEVQRVRLPGSEGSFEVLKNHAPLMSSLEDGEVRVITESGEELFFDVKGGFVEVLDNKISVLV
ncbi:MAG: ATP synthase F1 subunit epsilon [Bacteroidia bacterium]